MAILNSNMFNFIIRSIREQDALEGHDFLKRFLLGGQAVWETIQGKIESVKNLWSVTECPDEYLQYLKRIVGWTSNLDTITEDLDYAALRRLILISIPIWKSRTTEDSIVRVLNVLVAERCRVWNWFDLRWVTDATILSEEHQGRDPWMIYFPGPAGDQEYWSNVRLVEPGADKHQIVKDTLNMMRPAGERYMIVYLKFLDLFETDNDASQWNVIVGNDPTVADGMIKLTKTSGIEVIASNASGSDDWVDYSIFARIRSPSSSGRFGLLFYYTPSTQDGYFAALDVANNKLYIKIISAGVEGALGGGVEFDFGSIGYTLQANVWYGLRVQVVLEGTAIIRFKVYLNGGLVINTTQALPGTTHLKGSVGLMHDSARLDCDEVEVFGLPIVTETVEINY